MIGEYMGHECIVNSHISVHLSTLLPLCIIVMYIWEATFVYYIEASPALTGIQKWQLLWCDARLGRHLDLHGMYLWCRLVDEIYINISWRQTTKLSWLLVHFYRSAPIQGSLSHEQNVRPSAKRVNCEKRKKPVPTFLHHMEDH